MEKPHKFIVYIYFGIKPHFQTNPLRWGLSFVLWVSAHLTRPNKGLPFALPLFVVMVTMIPKRRCYNHHVDGTSPYLLWSRTTMRPTGLKCPSVSHYAPHKRSIKATNDQRNDVRAGSYVLVAHISKLFCSWFRPHVSLRSQWFDVCRQAHLAPRWTNWHYIEKL